MTCINVLKLADAMLFADDTTLYMEGRNIDFLYVKMQRELELVTKWLKDNCLSMNIEKTKCMLITQMNNPVQINQHLFVDGKPIEEIDTFKLLGLTIDNHLTFETHVTQLIHKLNQFKFIMRKLSKVLPVHCMRNIYYSFVHSRLTYGTSIWGGLILNMLFNSLDKLQKGFLRIINKKGPFHESKPLFVKNKILKLEDVLNLELIMLIYKYQEGTLPSQIGMLFAKKNHEHDTRNTPSVCHHKTNLFNKSFMNKATLKWQEFSYLFEDVSSKLGVKKCYKYYCFQQYG